RCGRRSGAHGGAPVARQAAGRRTAAGSRAAPVAAPACTRSSTTSTRGRCGPVTYSPRRSSPARPGRRKAAAPASSSSARRSSNTATRTASSSSPRAVSVCAPRNQWGPDGLERRGHARDGRCRRPETHADRAVRRRLRRLQPAAHGRALRDEGRRLSVGVRARNAHDGHDRATAQVHAEVALGAAADAGLTLDDVDGYFCAADAPGFGALTMADYLGLKKLSYLDSTEMGGSSYVAHVGHAAAAIAAGKCSVALITLAGRPRHERFFGRF